MQNPEGEQPGQQKRERQVFEDTEHTPGWLKTYIFSKFPITHDAEGTALPVEWPSDGFVFQHPPHDEAQLWCEKAVRETAKGTVSVLLLPFVCNSIYWRTVVYPGAAELHILTCPIKKPNAKKQIVSQMCLAIFAKTERNAATEEGKYPPTFFLEPDDWESNYYKRPRNHARFAIRQ